MDENKQTLFEQETDTLYSNRIAEIMENYAIKITGRNPNHIKTRRT